MDVPASIITQVNANGDQVIVNPDSFSKPEPVPVKQKRGLLGTLLCCVGGLRKPKSVSIHNSRDSVKVSDENGVVNNVQPAVRVIAQENQNGSTQHENGNLNTEPNHNHIQRPGSNHLLPQLHPRDTGKKCMVIDLDETLVHSSFKPIDNADFIVPVEIDGTVHQVYVLKRPHVDLYLQKMGELYECILFTASLAKYADPVADLLDQWGVFRARLFRESCVFHRGNYVKDLSRLGRDLSQIIIIDNSPASYIFHPDNAVPVMSWFDDMTDTELRDIIPLLDNLSKEKEVYTMLKSSRPAN